MDDIKKKYQVLIISAFVYLGLFIISFILIIVGVFNNLECLFVGIGFLLFSWMVLVFSAVRVSQLHEELKLVEGYCNTLKMYPVLIMLGIILPVIALVGLCMMFTDILDLNDVIEEDNLEVDNEKHNLDKEIEKVCRDIEMVKRLMREQEQKVSGDLLEIRSVLEQKVNRKNNKNKN